MKQLFKSLTNYGIIETLNNFFGDFMNIDDKLLEKLEKLSSLKLDDETKQKMKSSLNEVVSFVENLNDLDLDSLPSIASTIEGGTPLREDEPKSNPEVIKQVLEVAPKSEDGFFVVPKIIE